MFMLSKQSLPIDSYLTRISLACRENPFCVLTAPPGSGKTTRVPAELMQSFKKIVVLVPRRIAALSSAQRIADENNFTLGQEVGYQVRFENKASTDTRLIFMTEGVFIKKLNDPALWKDLELVILDEFHERSSLIDIALGLCFERQVLKQVPNLLVMSATLNANKLADFFGECARIDVEDKPHSLEIIKSKKPQRLICDQIFADHIVETLKSALQRSQKDILIFLPGLSEIRFVERILTSKINALRIEILHGSIRLEDQRRILQPSSERRLILSTNVAESSLTLPSVDCVIDSGLVKKTRTEVKIGFKGLELSRISLFSARQRAGRAARTGPGLCYQLWHESDEKSMNEQIIPEIITSDLLEECLILAAAGITPTQFSWLDKPKKSFAEVLTQLQAWGLLDLSFKLTGLGKKVQSCPLDIERSILFVLLSEEGFGNEAAQLMAYLETTSFDRLKSLPDIENLNLNENGVLVVQQLKRLALATPRKESSFREALIRIFLQKFPHKIAQRKERQNAISSRGRGVEMASYLVGAQTDYYILLSGREISSALSRCEFALGLTSAEFERSAQNDITAKTEILFDSEKQKLYKITQKKIGIFILTESSKIFLSADEEKIYFSDFLKDHLMEILESRESYVLIKNKLNFLEKKKSEIGLTEADFMFLQNFSSLIFENIGYSTHSFSDLATIDLKSLIEYSIPDPVKSILIDLPNEYLLPRGKRVKIDYESEQAPKISAKIQEFFGVKNNPTLLNGKLRMTIELLAPNYRPAQLTSQLENFWSTSYLEIRKELKARYPRHAWPEDPFAPIEE